jgi:(E)-4-hydroxy-3-methyl-but-2-enyl pyrophosphate reductase
LGSLVHNNDVVRSIEDIGVKKIDFKGKIGDVVNKIDQRIGTLVVTAHGIGPKIFEIAKQKGIDIVDTTCPKVIKAQRLAEVFCNRSRQIIIIGKKKHKETMGIFRWAKKQAKIVENKEDVRALNFPADSEITVISQTTQNKDRVDEVVNEILKKYPKAEILDTVCDTTKSRQQEAKDLAKNNDIVLVIGSPDSSNSTELWNIAKKINPNSYFIERVGDIKDKWLVGCEKVGITAGASSPKWIIAEVQKHLSSF